MNTSKSIIQFSLSAALSVSLFVSCSKETETLAPQPVEPSEEATKIIGDAEPAAPPAFSDVEEDTNSLPFPIQSSFSARATTGGITDYVDFNDETSLSYLPDYAISNVAVFPFYIQKVGNAWIHVKENNTGNYNPEFMSNYGHYHLGYERFVPCPDNGTWGKPVRYGDGCIPFDPLKQPRRLATHDGHQWIKIYAYDYNNSSRVFDLLGITVLNGPVQIWYRKADGKWYNWHNVGEAKWNLSAKSTGVTQVLISSASGGSVTFDDIKVRVPAY